MIYIEYISRRPGVSIESFHAVAGLGQTGWASSYGDDRLLLNLGRSWRMGPEPEYLSVWWYPGSAGLARIDDWDRIFKSGEADAFEEPFRLAARIDVAGCYRELLDPVEPTGRPFYAELFDLAPGATREEAADWFRGRTERQDGLTLVLACVRIGRLGPEPAGLAFWQAPSYAAMDAIAEELDGVEHPVLLRRAALYDNFGEETLTPTGRGRVAGKLALVTGAGSGIGRAVALRLAEEGAAVVVTSQTAAHVEGTAAELAAAGAPPALARVLDVRDAAAVDRVVAEVVDRFGRIDVVSNNAGIDLVGAPALHETADEDWNRLFDVNVTGILRVCRASIPHMPRGGSIVNMASINSLSVAWPNDAAYTASKGALLQLTRAAALDCAPRGIRVNCVCPGVIDTPLNDGFLQAADDPAALRREWEAVSPLRRFGTAPEVAHCVLFLASDEASFVSGAALVVDGATTAGV